MKSITPEYPNAAITQTSKSLSMKKIIISLLVLLCAATIYVNAQTKIFATAPIGGPGGGGTVFGLNVDGSDFTLLKSFLVDGSGPGFGPIARGPGGYYYGTVMEGGLGSGSIYKTQLDGTGYSIIHHFDNVHGGTPLGGVTIGPDGRIFGTTSAGGSQGRGTIYSVNSDGTDYRLLHEFAGTDGESPRSTLVWGSTFDLYGVAYTGGAYSRGTLYRINSDGTGFTVLLHFNPSTDGQFLRGNPSAWTIFVLTKIVQMPVHSNPIALILSDYI